MKTHLAGLVAGLTAATLAFPLLNALPAAAADTTNAATPGTTAGSVKAAVNLTAPASGTYGTNARFSGTAWRYGTQTRLAGATIVLQRSVHGKAAWSNLTSAKTTTTGTFAMGVTLSGGYDYRAYYAGSATYSTAISAVKYVVVMQKVILDGLSTTNNSQSTTNNGTLNAKGRVFPAPPTGTKVWLQKYDTATRTWKNFMSGKTSGNAITVKGDIPGSVGTYRLSVPSRGYYYTGSSGSKLFAHYVWRGLFTRPALATGGTAGHFFDVSNEPEDLGGYAVLGAQRGGTAWADLRTVGCLSMYARVQNITSFGSRPTRERVAIHRDGKNFRAVDLAPGEFGRFYGLTEIKGASKVRILVQDLGGTGEPISAWDVSILCSN